MFFLKKVQTPSEQTYRGHHHIFFLKKLQTPSKLRVLNRISEPSPYIFFLKKVQTPSEPTTLKSGHFHFHRHRSVFLPAELFLFTRKSRCLWQSSQQVRRRSPFEEYGSSI
jgi:hypothetical protein